MSLKGKRFVKYQKIKMIKTVVCNMHRLPLVIMGNCFPNGYNLGTYTTVL